VFATLLATAVGAAWISGRLTHHLAADRRLKRQPPAVVLYHRLLQLLARRGLRKPGHLTPREFAELAGQRLRRTHEEGAELATGVDRIRDLFCVARFGGKKLSSRQMEDAHGILRMMGASGGRWWR